MILCVNRNAKEKWKMLIHYGIKRGEFREVNVDELVNVIMYSYEGIRMWSRIIPMKPKTIRSMITLKRPVKEYERSFTFEGEEADVHMIHVV